MGHRRPQASRLPRGPALTAALIWIIAMTRISAAAVPIAAGTQTAHWRAASRR
jgi:hypothetical protein